MLEAAIKIVGEFVFNVVFEFIFYWPGWLILRVVTIGRYPPDQSVKHDRTAVACVGFISVVITVSVYFYAYR
jgi:hypothetical protein